MAQTDAGWNCVRHRIADLRSRRLDVRRQRHRTRSALLRGKGCKQRLVPVGRPGRAALDAYLWCGTPGAGASWAGKRRPIFVNARGRPAAAAKAPGMSALRAVPAPASRRWVAATCCGFLCHPLLEAAPDVRFFHKSFLGSCPRDHDAILPTMLTRSPLPKSGRAHP